MHGSELWRTDGTEANTVMVKDINGEGTMGSFPVDAVVLGNAALLGAKDEPHGFELWRTDGTEAGTVLVKDFSPGTNDGWCGFFGNGCF